MRVIFPDSQKYARSKKNGVGKIARFKFKWFEQGVGLQSVQNVEHLGRASIRGKRIVGQAWR